MIHIILGTKAQLIKMAPIMKSMHDANVPYNFISTGQHRDTMEDILKNFGIKGPDYTLYSGKDITSIPAMMVWSIRILFVTFFKRRQIFQNDRKGIALVHGDTFSTVLGAIMAKLGRLKVAHVESGLRSFNLFQPFPEELTRLVTFRLSDIMFCPGDWAARNLSRMKGKVVNTETNTLHDSLVCALPSIESIDGVVIPDKPYAIATLHRFENFRNQAAVLSIVESLERIAKKKYIICILHKPTEINLRKYGYFERLSQNPNIEMRPRYDYFRFIKLILSADFIVSDGGSNQEECFYLGKPLLLLRNVSERQEGIGENAVISRFDAGVIDDFSTHFHRYKRPRLQQHRSPSKEIVDACSEFV